MFVFLSERLIERRAAVHLMEETKTFPDDCVGDKIKQGYPFGERYSLPANDFICVDASDTAFLALGDSLEISGNTQDNRTIGPRSNAWGGTRGWYKIRATKETDVTLFMSQQINVPESYEYQIDGYPNVKGTSHYVMSLKNEWDGFGYTDVELKSFDKSKPNEAEGSSQSEIIYILNPGKSEVKFEPKCSKTRIVPEPEGGFQKDQEYFLHDQLIEFQPVYKNIGDFLNEEIELDHKYVSLVLFRYEHESKPAYWPDINVELRGSDIFDENTESYSFLGHGKLQTWEIALIVVACLVVVLIIIIVIIYCCCRSICCCCKCCQDKCGCCNCCQCCRCLSASKHVYDEDLNLKSDEN